jgi:hypothetical protein
MIKRIFLNHFYTSLQEKFVQPSSEEILVVPMATASVISEQNIYMTGEEHRDIC